MLRERIIEDTLRGSPGAKRAWPEEGMIADISGVDLGSTDAQALLDRKRKRTDQRSAVRYF